MTDGLAAIVLLAGFGLSAAVLATGPAGAESASHIGTSLRSHNIGPFAGGTSTAPPFNECPAVGGDKSCTLLVIVTDHGDEILDDPTQPQYDVNIGAEDTMVGVLNESSKPLTALQLASASAPIFGFDGDGICTFAPGGINATQPGSYTTGSSYCTFSRLNGQDTPSDCAAQHLPATCGDALGADYEGPDNTFSNISTDTMSGQVNFDSSVLPGSSSYFSLEEPLTTCSFASQCGYWEVASDGGLFAFSAPFFGSMGGKPLNSPIVAIADDPITGGYWEVGADGGLFSFNAPFFGSMGGKPLNSPIVGMVATPDGQGYLEVASDGGLFAFGDAGFFGSMGGKPLNSPVVGISITPNGQGYFEVASDGGLFAFGNAVFHGSEGGQPLNSPIVAMTSDNENGGYWEVGADGGLFAFGGAQFFGSMGGMPLNAPIVGMTSTPNGAGYLEVASDGGLFAFGNAHFVGSMGGQPLNAPIVGIATSGA